jgi:hypothetical protein
MKANLSICAALSLLLAGCASKPVSPQDAARQAEDAAKQAQEAADKAAAVAKAAAEKAREASRRAAEEEARKSGRPAAPPKPLRLEAGAELVVRTTSTLSTKTAKSGDTFVATLEEPLATDGVVIAAKGAEVKGRVVESDPGGRVKGVASLTLELTELTLKDGKTVAIDTSNRGVAAPASKQKDAVKVGIGAGVGAAIGAIAGGGKGAAIGAASGGAAGTGVVLATRGEPAVIRAETVLRFPLTSAVEIPR